MPEGSVWDRNLKQMAEEWKQATGGRVTVTVFGGGSQGDEATVLRKMRLDALQAASFTAVGLGSIDPAFNVFDVPFFFESYDELNDVTAKLTPVIAKRLDAKGFVLLNWGHGGWTQLFTKRPVRTLADLKTIKLYTSAGNDRMVQWFKANGFQPRPMAMTDIMTGLTHRHDRRAADAGARRAAVSVVPADAVHARHRPRAGRRREHHHEEDVGRPSPPPTVRGCSSPPAASRSVCRPTCRSRIRRRSPS